MASCFDVTFDQPSLGLDLFPHKISIQATPSSREQTVACCQVQASKNTIDIQKFDILVSVNGVSLFGDQELKEHESSQIHFETAVDRIVESTVPRTVRVFRLWRPSPAADGMTAVILTAEETAVLRRGPLPPPPPPPPLPQTSVSLMPMSSSAPVASAYAPPMTSSVPVPVPLPVAPMSAPVPVPVSSPVPAETVPVPVPYRRDSSENRASISSTSSSSRMSYAEQEKIRMEEEEERKMYTESFNKMVKQNRAKREQDRLEEGKMAEEAKRKKEELLRLLGAKPKTPIKTGEAGANGTDVIPPANEMTEKISTEEAQKRKKEYLKMLGSYVRENEKSP